MLSHNDGQTWEGAIPWSDPRKREAALQPGETTQVSDSPVQWTTRVDMDKANSDGSGYEKFIEKLKETHSLYDANIDAWKMLGDIGEDRLTISNRYKYLKRGEAEDKVNYKQRLRLSEFIPESPVILEQFISTTLREKAVRNFPASFKEKCEAFNSSADVDERELPHVIKDLLRLSLIYGCVDMFLTHPVDEGTEVPYAILYRPESRINWQIDDKGQYKWIKYYESECVQNSWSADKTYYNKYKIITAPTVGENGEIEKGKIYYYRVFDIGDRTYVEQMDASGAWLPPSSSVQPMEHDFHRVPVLTFYWNYMEPGIGGSWIKQMAASDLKTYRMESDLIWDTYLHLHPLIVTKLVDDPRSPGYAPQKRLKLGANSFITLWAGNKEEAAETLEYVNPNCVPALNLAHEMIKAQRDITRRLANYTVSSQVEQGAHPESGLALSLRQDMLTKHLHTAARSLEDLEVKLFQFICCEFDDAAKAMSDIEVKEALKDLTVVYPTRFDMNSTAEINEQFKESKEGKSPTLIAELEKSRAHKYLGSGASEDLLKIVMKEIDEDENIEDENIDKSLLEKAVEIEHKEHPEFSIEEARKIARDHLIKDPHAYDKEIGQVPK